MCVYTHTHPQLLSKAKEPKNTQGLRIMHIPNLNFICYFNPKRIEVSPFFSYFFILSWGLLAIFRGPHLQYFSVVCCVHRVSWVHPCLNRPVNYSDRKTAGDAFRKLSHSLSIFFVPSLWLTASQGNFTLRLILMWLKTLHKVQPEISGNLSLTETAARLISDCVDEQQGVTCARRMLSRNRLSQDM